MCERWKKGEPLFSCLLCISDFFFLLPPRGQLAIRANWLEPGKVRTWELGPLGTGSISSSCKWVGPFSGLCMEGVGDTAFWLSGYHVGEASRVTAPHTPWLAGKLSSLLDLFSKESSQSSAVTLRLSMPPLLVLLCWTSCRINDWSLKMCLGVVRLCMSTDLDVGVDNGHWEPRQPIPSFCL